MLFSLYSPYSYIIIYKKIKNRFCFSHISTNKQKD